MFLSSQPSLRNHLAAIACLAPLCACAADDANAGSSQFDGDRLKLYVAVPHFTVHHPDASKAKAAATEFCGPPDSKLSAFKDGGDKILVRFIEIEPDKNKACGDTPPVQLGVQYEIAKSMLATDYDVRRTGATFGALVIPFKFRIGADNPVSSSSTIAPYVGWRTGLLSSYGITLTPYFSAGLGLVPVSDPTTGTTDTRNAFSAATGLVLRSSKSDAFQFGIAFGKDFLDKQSKLQDPSVNKPWISVFIGLTSNGN
ncbi:MAG TPA: hypothetical protein VFW93_00970 [Aquabacterium sp.]|uniref:hypothetical protein n=1 Tax=Aquabacterium sp. TaxID=1872578 RepID=UPI002E30FBCD|nr:hypothetical protein [Aquabacterium sp.]HEX5354757.1 hypothetical protein [Aquabacterium sp.]